MIDLRRVISQAIADIARQFGLSRHDVMMRFQEFIEDDSAQRLADAIARECEREEA